MDRQLFQWSVEGVAVSKHGMPFSERLVLNFFKAPKMLSTNLKKHAGASRVTFGEVKTRFKTLPGKP